MSLITVDMFTVILAEDAIALTFQKSTVYASNYSCHIGRILPFPEVKTSHGNGRKLTETYGSSRSTRSNNINEHGAPRPISNFVMGHIGPIHDQRLHILLQDHADRTIY